MMRNKKLNNLYLGKKFFVSDDVWNKANKDILWGWKRDENDLQRVIFFKGKLNKDLNNDIFLSDWYFFYKHRADEKSINNIYKTFSNKNISELIGIPTIKKSNIKNLSVIELCGGTELTESKKLISRLIRRKPRKFIPEGKLPKEVFEKLKLDNNSVVLYAGSGLSYECGLPTLGNIHELFRVDVLGTQNFTFGVNDSLPSEISSDIIKSFGGFCNLHLKAMETIPSNSHNIIKKMFDNQIFTRVLTDNVDNIFSLIDIPFTRTRGLGIFNDPHKIKFNKNEKILLVVGVAADRRSVIKQARSQGLKIIVVNNYRPVSPKSQNLSYMRSEDTWYKMSANDFFNNCVIL